MNLFRVYSCDAAEPWQIGFQDPATPVMQGLIDLHHDLMFFLSFILVFVCWILGRTLYHFNASKHPTPYKITHGTLVEVVWTVTPSIILMLITAITLYVLVL